MSLMKTLLRAGAVVFALALASPAAAAAGGDSNAPPPASGAVQCAPPTVPNADATACAPCPKGTKYDADKKVCVTDNASLMDDPTLYQIGRRLALAGYYQDALDTLGAIRNKHDAMVLTMIGYSTRKLGHTDEGIAIYHQALAIDPDNVNTHEYLGEGYLTAGRIDLAENELDTLAKLCGTDCSQYRTLKNALFGDGVWH